MNLAEIKAWRENTAAMAEAQLSLANARTEIERRQREEVKAARTLSADVVKRISLVYARSAYGMVIDLLQAPDSDIFEPAEKMPFLDKEKHERVIHAPEIGDFRATALTSPGVKVDNKASSLGLLFLYLPGTSVNSSDRERIEPVLEKNDMLSLSRVDGYKGDLEDIFNRRETVAQICKQAGVEVEEVPTIGEAIAAATAPENS